MLVALPRSAGEQLEIPTPSRFIRAPRATTEADRRGTRRGFVQAGDDIRAETLAERIR